jgi:hypothetical protein
MVEQGLIKSVVQGKNINIIETSLCLNMNRMRNNLVNNFFMIKNYNYNTANLYFRI